MSDMKELARRAVACKHWRWMPGMAAHSTRPSWHVAHHTEVRVTGVGDWGVAYVGPCQPSVIADPGWRGRAPFHHEIPNLQDAATLGCLLRLVREAWGDTDIYPRVEWWDGVFTVVVHDTRKGNVLGAGPGEAVALVAALESAP
jgi:hypothetical protein